jgi:predicted dehydrogenase
MTTPLGEEFAALRQTERGLLLNALMRLCQTQNQPQRQRISVVCLGAGDAFINRYWPTLVPLVIKEFVHLVVADNGPLDEVIRTKVTSAIDAGRESAAKQLERNYAQLSQMVGRSDKFVTYLNLADPKDRAQYYFLVRVSVVFILVPDDIHVRMAQEWLGRADLVLIEKPYDRDFPEAQRFEADLKDLARAHQNHPHTVVICIDHYLAKIFAYIMNRQAEVFNRRVGRIHTVEFRLCEASPVEPWRAISLEAGMVYDLFCHVLAMVSPFVDLTTFRVRTGPKTQILVAQHVACPIPAETFAWIRTTEILDFGHGPVALEGALGKGIWSSGGDAVVAKDEKYIKFVGEDGTIYANLDPSSPGMVSLMADEALEPLFEVGKGHKEMLDAIFSGRFLDEPVGGLKGDTAAEILRILNSIRTGSERAQRDMQREDKRYGPGETVETIKLKAVALR